MPKKKPTTKKGKTKPRTRKPGRPVTKPFSLPDEAYKMAQAGCSDNTIRAVFGFSAGWFVDGLKANPHVAERLRDAREKALAKSETTLFMLGNGLFETTYVNKKGEVKTVRKPPDFHALRFWLCNRAPSRWRAMANVSVEHNGIPEPKERSLEELNYDDLSRLAQDVIAEQVRRRSGGNGGDAEQERPMIGEESGQTIQ